MADNEHANEFEMLDEDENWLAIRNRRKEPTKSVAEAAQVQM